ncbi:pimeloyl-ACP methyl ester carboxylesterase [Granulicella aggregans]|uniref:Pimeloyl-ACP methyl ester carboxylesterase n=1 Tax=Granulicella aggregans TaxID=474949 RepID=A0A7W7ZK36_9BACT|nr:alpha/beta hydrolase [Granulicella aggregans]MBB5061375.1 pimeloyl-ACP methyl ester carboxylesterase [Granulicella aggregans]
MVARKIDASNAGHHLLMTSYAVKGLAIKHATIVFESGLGGGEDHWKKVIDQLPKGAMAITYERAGMNGSAPDGVPPSPEHIATVLHAALAHVASPPYVLVGHSWGGPLVRAFAGLFPKDVSGLVLVEPTDFGETAEERRRYIYEFLGHGEDGEKLRAAVDAYYAQQAGHFDPGVEADIQMSRDERRDDFRDFKNLPMPPVPIVVIATTRYPFTNDPHLPVSYDQAQYQQLMLNYRLLSLGRFARSVPDGTLVTTARSGHYVQEEEPKLVVWGIRRVLRPARLTTQH